jgi:hypothetical protein
MTRPSARLERLPSYAIHDLAVMKRRLLAEARRRRRPSRP